MRHRLLLWPLLTCFFPVVIPQVVGQDGPRLAPYFPTPMPVVQRMLQLGRLQAGEKLFDLGSGDGRIIIIGAKKFKADATGLEIDEDLCHTSAAGIHRQHLDRNARIVCGDLLKQDISSADLVTVYLWPESNEKVRLMLEAQLKKGARVVAHDFEIPGWKASRVETIENDGAGRSHTIFLYLR